MAHERATRGSTREQIVPRGLLVAEAARRRRRRPRGHLHGTSWRASRKQPGTLGDIFRKAQNRIQDPAKLKRLIVDLIDQENWSASGTDIKGDAYEELLSKGAEDIKSGAGQYFTPRALIQAMVECIDPTPSDTVVDPAAGTGGFLLAAHEHAARDAANLTPEERAHLRDEFVHGCRAGRRHRPAGRDEPAAARDRQAERHQSHRGQGLADRRPGRLGIGGAVESAVRPQVVDHDGRRRRSTGPRGPGDRAPGLRRHDVQQAAELRPAHRDDLERSTVGPRSSCPDNVLFEGGAGETIRRRLLHDFDLHTLLRLPTGIFYAQGVKANVLFFDRKPASERPWTERLWVYDLRTNMHFTLKQNRLAAPSPAGLRRLLRAG